MCRLLSGIRHNGYNNRRMIISASRRTDIPAFHAAWFLQAVREGSCRVANPFNPAQVSEISLRPEAVDALVFWTRNAAPLLPHLAELDARGYRYYFLYTLTGYPRVLEPGVPPREEALATMRRLAECLGPDRLIWRYDPIILTTITPPAYHAENFARLAATLRGATSRVKISFFDEYRGATGGCAGSKRKGLLACRRLRTPRSSLTCCGTWLPPPTPPASG